MSVNFNYDHGMVNIILHCRKNNPTNISPNIPKNSAEAYVPENRMALVREV